jgi:hypothetical protein
VQSLGRIYHGSDAFCVVKIPFSLFCILFSWQIFKPIYGLRRNKETSNKIREYFETKRIMKQYIAITKGVPKLSDGEINIPLLRREVNGIFKVNLIILFEMKDNKITFYV